MSVCNEKDERDADAVTAFEAMTRRMVEELADDVREIRERINGLFWLIAGTVVVDLILRVSGLGA